ncbi:MAG: radical SAM protein [Acutalibacteraceae bacterium]
MNFKSVCWDITSKCNEQCLFCYRDTDSEEASLEKNKKILKNLISIGVGKISFVGGEPLLYKHLFELINYGRSLDNRIQYSLTTNAVLLATFDGQNDFKINTKLLEKIVCSFDWITFSMDAPTDQLQTEMGRNSHHISRVINLLEYISSLNCDIRIKINTVVSKVNINSLHEMIPLLETYRINRWKLFKFLPSRGEALVNKDMFEISTQSYQKCINELIQKSHLNITYNNDVDFQKTYITINSKGYLSVYDGSKYNLLIDMSTQDCSKVFDYVNEELHNKRRFNYGMGEDYELEKN